MNSFGGPAASELLGVLSRWRLLAICAAVVIGLAAIRLATGGWEAMGADHARYVYAGMSLLDGRGYVNESGDTYLLRAPAYPVMLGAAYALAGANGAHLAAWSLALASLLLAIALAGRLGGPLAGLVATAAILTVPQFWEQIVSVGIDLPQAAFYVAVIILLLEPKPARWLAAGALLGVALLIKETLAPAVFLLPIAWLPVWSGLDWRGWARLTFLFLLATALVAGWWWLLVWRETGLLFPLNSLQAIVPDEATPSLSLTPTIAITGVVAGAAWAYLIYRRFHESGVRLLVFATLALGPAVVATIALAQPERNLSIVVLLSCVAAGIALSDAWRGLAPRASVGLKRVGGAAVVVALIAGITIGQVSVVSAAQDPLPGDTAAVLREGLAPGDEVISTFRYRSALGVELFDEHVFIRLIPVRAVTRAVDPAGFLWLGERRGTLFGLTRDNWKRVLGSPGAAYLVLIAPHPLTPEELLPALRSRDGEKAGLAYMERLKGPAGTAEVFDISPDRIDLARQIHVHAQPGALVHWLDRAQEAGVTDAVETLLDARPVVLAHAPDLANLAHRLGAGACFRPRSEGGEAVLSIEPAELQDDCLSTAELER